MIASYGQYSAHGVATGTIEFVLGYYITTAHCKKGFDLMTIIFFTRVTTVDMVVWEDTRIVHHDSQLWAIQYTWSSYRNNGICYKGWEDCLDIR